MSWQATSVYICSEAIPVCSYFLHFPYVICCAGATGGAKPHRPHAVHQIPCSKSLCFTHERMEASQDAQCGERKCKCHTSLSSHCRSQPPQGLAVSVRWRSGRGVGVGVWAGCGVVRWVGRLWSRAVGGPAVDSCGCGVDEPVSTPPAPPAARTCTTAHRRASITSQYPHHPPTPPTPAAA